jgi:lipoate---protein ligase
MQILKSAKTDPGFNLAAEEYLFNRQGEETLFLYVNAPCIVIGCNQAVFAEVDTSFCASEGIGLFRRLSGGGAVFHDEGNLNFCFIKDRIPGQSALGQAFLEPITVVLHEMGIPVEIGSRKDLWLSKDFKVSGTASHVGKNRELHHGTLLYDSSLGRLQQALTPTPGLSKKSSVASVPSPVKNIRDYLLENGLETFDAPSFFQQMYGRLLTYYDLSEFQRLSPIETAEIEEIAARLYRSTAWTFKK